MKVFVVFCHPTRTSFTGAVLERVLAGLATAGHEVRVVDLYAEGFRPELSRDERLVHMADHRAEPELRPGTAHHVEHLLWADALVLVYPTWWSGQPAMLKGWFDRVLASGVAWHLPEGTSKIKPLLGHIDHLVAVTSHGSSKFVNAMEGEGGKRTVSRSVRVLCGLRCRTRWVAMYGIDRATPGRRQAFLDRVERRLARL